MFDVGFSELALIAIVALVVLGPERLPEAARALGKWVGRARRMMRQMSEELEREVDVSDLRAQFRDAKRSVEEEWEDSRWYGGKSDTSSSDDAEWDDEPDEAEVYGGGVSAEDAADSAEEEPAAASVHEEDTAPQTSQDEEPPQEANGDEQAGAAASDAGAHDEAAAESPDLQQPGEEPAEAPKTARKRKRSTRKRNSEQEEPAVESVEPERESPHSRVH